MADEESGAREKRSWIDLGDKLSRYAVVSAEGEVVEKRGKSGAQQAERIGKVPNKPSPEAVEAVKRILGIEEEE